MGRTIYPPPGTIKSIQRGVATGNGNITISTINPSKSVVSLQGAFGANSFSDSTTAAPYVASLSSGLLNVSNATYRTNTDVNYSFSWQIVEYF